MVNTLTASMMIDSTFILFSSLHALTKAHVSNRRHKKRDSNGHIDQILHERPPDTFRVTTSLPSGPTTR